MSDKIRQQDAPPPEGDESRRTFLKAAAGALGACYLGGVGYSFFNVFVGKGHV